MIIGEYLALYGKYIAVSYGPNRAAQPTSRNRSQAHFISRKLQIKRNHESQQFVDDASRFTAVSGKNSLCMQISNLQYPALYYLSSALSVMKRKCVINSV